MAMTSKMTLRVDIEQGHLFRYPSEIDPRNKKSKVVLI